MSPSFFDFVQWASGLVLAIPLAIIAIEFLTQGRQLLGGAFLMLAIAMFLLPEYLTRRVGSPRSWITSRFGKSLGRSK